MLRVCLRLEQVHPVVDVGETPMVTVIGETQTEVHDEDVTSLSTSMFWSRYLMPAWHNLRDLWRQRHV